MKLHPGREPSSRNGNLVRRHVVTACESMRPVLQVRFLFVFWVTY